MSMISELVKELREFEDLTNPKLYSPKITQKLLLQAADAIESLSAKLAKANMENGGGWVACEDRLPEINHFYAVTIFDGEDCRAEPAYYAKIGYLGMRELKPNWWTDCTSNAEMIEDGEDKVIAWQPLPEPYQESDTVDTDRVSKNQGNKANAQEDADVTEVVIHYSDGTQKVIHKGCACEMKLNKDSTCTMDFAMVNIPENELEYVIMGFLHLGVKLGILDGEE